MECGKCRMTLNAEEERAYEVFKGFCPTSKQDCICVRCIDEEQEQKSNVDLSPN